MYIVYTIFAGVIGTLLMTIFINIGARITGYNFHVPAILGSLLLMNTKPSGRSARDTKTLLTGYIAHYSIGIIFALVFVHVFTIDNLQYRNALLFGVLAGASAVGFWFGALKLHPLAPKVNLGLYLVHIFLGHLVFSIGMNAAFRLTL